LCSRHIAKYAGNFNHLNGVAPADFFNTTGSEFYSLAEACQDRYLDIKMKEAERSGGEVQAEKQSWA
jgi:hypothetical protein